MNILQITKDNGPVQKALFSHQKEIGISSKVFSYAITLGAKHNDDGACVYKPFFKVKGPLFVFLRLKPVARYLASDSDLINCDLIHAHFLSMDGKLAYDIKKKKGIPYVVTVRNTDLYMYGLWEFPWNKRILLRILENADGVIFLSETYREELKKRIKNNRQLAVIDNAYVIPNGIDDFWILNRQQKRGVIDKKFVRILTVGDISKNKNQIMVVKALEKLKLQGIYVRYTVIGKCIERGIKKELLSRGVTVIDFCSKEELIDYYRSNDIFVMVSIKESFGLVYAEALTQSLPVVYSKGQGFYGQFEEGVVGYGVNPFSPDEIASAIVKIIDRYDFLSDSAFKNSTAYEWDAVANRTVNVYKKIICQRKSL